MNLYKSIVNFTYTICIIKCRIMTMLIKYYVNIFVEGVGEKRKFSKYCSLRWKSLTPTIYRWAVWVVYLRLITTKSSHMDIMM
jgi:hypothetical protein